MLTRPRISKSHASTAASQLAILVVIPCRNEAENLPILIDEVEAAMAGRDYEIIVVNDGSTDDTAAGACRAPPSGASAPPYPARKSAGQSAVGALGRLGGARHNRRDDGRRRPERPGLPADAGRRAAAGGPKVGIAAGQRLKRSDSKIKQLASRFANWLRGRSCMTTPAIPAAA